VAYEYSIAKSVAFSEIDDNRAGKITTASISDAVIDEFSRENIDPIFISYTSLRAFELVSILGDKLQCKITTSKHGLAWHMLRLSGINDKHSDKEKLFKN
tara:strand:- start:1445 stop:1744 length:300 start_codon:yes stop_codon:yes gene_type:complete